MISRRSFVYTSLLPLPSFGSRLADPPPVSTVFEPKMISSGENRPSVNVRDRGLSGVCVGLHRGSTRAALARELSISEPELDRRISTLVSAGLIRQQDGVARPTCLIIGLDDAKWFGTPDTVIGAAVGAVESRLPGIKRRAMEIGAIRRTGFAPNSLLLLSNVLLDNWQIQDVERRFVKSERPLRNGSRYYFSLMEKEAAQEREAFGIYGNAGGSIAGISLGVYGNRRYNGKTLVSIGPEQFRSLVSAAPDANLDAEVASLLQRAADLARSGKSLLEPRQLDCLRALGMADQRGNLLAPVFTSAEAVALAELASSFTDDLLGVLESHRAALESTYRKSPYPVEVTPSEYVIWWYHFFYTAVTDRLAARGLIELPASGNVTYLILKG